MKSFYDLFWKLFYADEDFWRRMWENDLEKLNKALEDKKEKEETKELKCEDEKETHEDVPSCDYVQVDGPLEQPMMYFPPFFKLEDGEDGKVYVHRENVGKKIRPNEIEINIYEDGLCLYLMHNEKGEGWSSISSGNRIPEDLDRDTLKAVLKNGVLTITAKQMPPKEKEPEKEFEQEEDVEYEVEIGR